MNTSTPHTCISQDDANKLFVASLPKVKEGANALRVAEFIDLTKILTENLKSFSIQDAYNLRHRYDLDAAEVKFLWEKWVSVNLNQGRLSVVKGAYDNEIFFLNFK
jgi:hypothetical protein